MNIEVRKYTEEDLEKIKDIWNEVVEAKNAFPQIETLDLDEAKVFFDSQTYTAVAKIDGEIVGLYILHPNNVGRCGHICNASYAVSSSYRGKGIGEILVKDCLKQAKEHNFKILQFNAVVASNNVAISLYKKLGFKELGVIKGGFLNGDNKYEDIISFIYEL